MRETFTKVACVIVKHANPCDVTTGDTLLAAYDRAYQTDPTSAFGGIIAFNRPLDTETAKAIVSRQCAWHRHDLYPYASFPSLSPGVSSP